MYRHNKPLKKSLLTQANKDFVIIGQSYIAFLMYLNALITSTTDKNAKPIDVTIAISVVMP